MLTNPYLVPLKKAIDKATRKNCWYNPWKHEGDRADYRIVEGPLKEFLCYPTFDDITKVCAYLETKARRQVEHSHDEGDCAAQARYWMQKLVKLAIKHAPDPVELLVWAAEFSERDEYELAAAIPIVWDGRKEYEKSVWREVAAHLKSGHRKELYLKAVEKSKDVEELLEEAVADLPPRMRAAASGDFETALKLDWGELCKSPSGVSYRDLMDAARIVGREQEYHDKAFRFLESRKEYYLLTELALLEHRLDEAIGYYKLYANGVRVEFGRWTCHHDFDWDVADRIARYKPDEAIAIWLRIIKWNNHPDQVAYWHIGRALNNLKPVLLSLGRKAEWLNLIDSLIEANAKRPNLLEILRRCK